jgi:hypothetical protein
MVSFGDRSIVRQKRAYESLFDWENRGRIPFGFPAYDAVWVWGGIARTPDKDPDETGNRRVSRTTVFALGDCSSVSGPDGKPLPTTAQVGSAAGGFSRAQSC